MGDTSWVPDGTPTLREVREAYVRHVLDQYDGDRAKAAKHLGVSLKTVYNYAGPRRVMPTPEEVQATVDQVGKSGQYGEVAPVARSLDVGWWTARRLLDSDAVARATRLREQAREIVAKLGRS